MKTFRCKRSGNTVSFKLENDIESMRKHEGYEEVSDVQVTKPIETKSSESPAKKAPRVKTLPAFLQE